ncbi:MAG: hypothetical protein KDC12_02945 [Flavobacteriales bacterium]|nr:hypothetical protein [Flavobacteriales bacterium]
MKKPLIFLFAALLITLGFLTFRPIVNVDQDDCLTITGELYNAYETNTHDIVLVMSGDHRHFYINRGTEQGLSADEINKTAKGSQVTLWYVDHWSLLNWDKRFCHISRVEYHDTVLFSEIRDMD